MTIKALLAIVAGMPGMLLATVPAFAGHYDLIKGKGVEVCEEYLTHSVGDSEVEATCDREFNSGSPDIKRPVWEQLDPQKNKLLVLRIENYLQTPRDEKAMRPWVPVHREEALDSLYINEFARLATTQLDINNDGKPETVARFRSYRCDTWGQAATPRGPHWVAPIVVLDDTKQDVDREMTYPLMQNPGKKFVANAGVIDASRKSFFERQKETHAPPASFSELKKNIPDPEFVYSKYAPGSAERMGYDAFLFKQRTYFDKWDEQDGQKGIHILSVYHTQGSSTEDVCRFRWQD